MKTPQACGWIVLIAAQKFVSRHQTILFRRHRTSRTLNQPEIPHLQTRILTEI